MPLDAGFRELPLQVRASDSTLRSKRRAAFETQQSEPDTRPCQFTQIGNHMALTQRVKHPVIRHEQHALSVKVHSQTYRSSTVQRGRRQRKSKSRPVFSFTNSAK